MKEKRIIGQQGNQQVLKKYKEYRMDRIRSALIVKQLTFKVGCIVRSVNCLLWCLIQ